MSRHVCLGVWIAFLLATAALSAQVQLGSEALAAGGFKELQGKRVGLLTNPSGVNRAGRSTIELLRNAPGVKLVALFAPEHGLNAEIPAGTEFLDSTNAATGLPVFSLYGRGPTRKPTPKMLAGLDALVYDIQDIGCRSYTFISTMGLAMEACGQAGVEFVVLDRPNPLGGLRAEGPPLDPRFRSHVGQWEIPYVYGLTCGELAKMINGERWIKTPCKLTVIRMNGWQRSMTWKETGLKWVATSPKITSPEAATGYAALGLLGWIADGSGLDVGYKFNRPYESVTANWFDGSKLASKLADARMKGVRFVPISGIFEKRPYQGVRIEYTQPPISPLVGISFHILDAIKQVAGRDLFLEANRRGRDFLMFYKLTGSSITRRDLQAGRSAAGIAKSWKPGEDAFRARRQKYLLY
ncbi:MAG TPA: DUF1343 domain-containing protein [Verrucomicrobiae bacterium]|nr:DUF1343 domain-containing protein [Verrucomicrobiae bacterium]